MHAKPCFYCIILLTTLFISSCYWQPFPLDTPLSTPWSENITTFAEALNSTLSTNYSLPYPTVIRAVDRCWCDLTSGSFFEPFNVSQWEHLSVERLKDSLEKKQKALETPPRKLTEPGVSLEDDLQPKDNESSVSTLWDVLKILSPGFYDSFSHYMTYSEVVPDGAVLPDHAASPVPSSSPSASEAQDTLPATQINATSLPLIRKEYDLRPYGFNMVLDFRW